jgi:hypothetical protein
VAIAAGLDPNTKARLRGTWLENHQAGLRQLSTQPAETQHRICDLLFAVPPEATSVAEAMALAEGRRLPSAAEKLVANVMNGFPTASRSKKLATRRAKPRSRLPASACAMVRRSTSLCRFWSVLAGLLEGTRGVRRTRCVLHAALWLKRSSLMNCPPAS